VTKVALQEFAGHFEHRVPVNVLAAMRALFKVGDPEDDMLDVALLSHGGAAALDHDHLEAAVDGTADV
jgi:hypothetical protein